MTGVRVGTRGPGRGDPRTLNVEFQAHWDRKDRNGRRGRPDYNELGGGGFTKKGLRLTTNFGKSRALDYLLSRKEVDPARIGLTGNSGGGTHTAYIAALDDRIQVAAPSCYITSWHLMLDTIGPQDAEQTFPFWPQQGVDYPDYLYAFAPKPYLILSAIRDFFPIAGARETFAEGQKVYAAIGAREKLGMFEADDGHGYNKTRRLAAYDWFGRWLKGAGDTDPEPQIEMATPEELRCTPTGQVSTSLQGESVFTLNQKRLEKLKVNHPTRPGDLLRKEREAIRYGFLNI